VRDRKAELDAQATTLTDAGKVERSGLAAQVTELTTQYADAVRRQDVYAASPKTEEEQYLKDMKALYEKLIGDWETNKDAVHLRQAAAALGAQRRSMLVEFCRAELPFQLKQLGMNAQKFRKARLETRQRIETAESSAHVAEAQKALLAQFESSLKTCDSLSDNADKKACRERVFKLAGRE
jgi:hypothetical protein